MTVYILTPDTITMVLYIRQTPREGSSITHLTSTCRRVKVTKDKESLKNLQSQEEPNEITHTHNVLYIEINIQHIYKRKTENI